VNKTLSYVFCLLLVTIASSIHAQSPPTLRCISLDENDDITLEWTNPADTGADFNKFLIYYRASSTSPFSIISEVTDYSQTSVLLTGSYAGDGAFFMRTNVNSFADTSIGSDTVSPIILQVSNFGNVATLFWSEMTLASPDSTYRVFRQESGATSLQQFASTKFDQTSVLDSVSSCSTTVEYQVRIKGQGGCFSKSNVPEKLIVDDVPPLKTNLLYASVDTSSGLVDLAWRKSASPDGNGYFVYYFDLFVRTDTIYGVDVLKHTYANHGIDANAQAETLSVAPYDQCFDSSAMWYNLAADSLRLKTIFVDSIDYDVCTGKLAIKWNAPKGKFPVGVQNLSAFEVYRSGAGKPSERIGLLGAADSIYIDSGLIAGEKYTYVVVAIDEENGVKANSNKFVLDLKKASSPDYFLIHSIKNNHETGKNEVHVLVDSSAQTSHYRLLRSLVGSDKFVTIGEREAKSGSFKMVDQGSDAGQSSFLYKVQAYDVCDRVIGVSDSVESLFCQATKKEVLLENELVWNDYIGFDLMGSSELGYELVRVNTETEQLMFQPDLHEYVDDVSDLDLVSGRVCYYVRSVEADGNAFNKSDTTVSNLACVEFDPKAAIPNCFSPNNDAINDVFLPAVNFINQEAYTLQIFDRAGVKVFESTDPLEGWSGNGRPMGVYAYYLQMENASGDQVSFSGKVHLIR